MRSVSEILALVNAGYTKEEIAAMDEPSQDPPKADPPKAEPVKEEPAGQPTGAPDPLKSMQDTFTAFLTSLQQQTAEIKKETAEMQKANLQKTQQPPVQSTEDILAAIINPTE